MPESAETRPTSADAIQSGGRAYTDEDQTIFEALGREHRTLAGLFRQLEEEMQQDREQARALFLVLQTEFLGHSWAEDEVFYERLADAEDEDLTDAVEELRAEHGAIEELLSQIEEMEPSSGSWPARVGAVRERMERHIEKEERTIFDVAADVIGGDEQRALARELHAAREQIASEMSRPGEERPAADVAPGSGAGAARSAVEEDVEGKSGSRAAGLDELDVEFDVERPTVTAGPFADEPAADRGDEPESSVDDVDVPHRLHGPNEPIE